MLVARVIVCVAVFLFAAVSTAALEAKAPSTAAAVENSATVNTVVEAGKWATARLGNLPAGASLGIKVTANGTIGVLLIDARGVENFPDVERPLFKGRASRSLKFSIIVPRAGAYYLVIDNRAGNARRDVTIDISAVAPKPAASGVANLFDSQLKSIEASLKRVFTAVTLDIGTRRCGAAEIHGSPEGVIICTEYVRQLIKMTEDKALASGVMLFVLMREVGRIVLVQWDHPSAGDEATIDGFATALMVMFGQAERTRNQAEYFAAITAGSARHVAWDGAPPLSAERAGSVLGWIDDTDHLLAWQAILVPRMRTEYLLVLNRAPKPWTDRLLVIRELAARRF